MQIAETITSYINYCTDIKQLSEHSIRSYRFALQQFEALFATDYNVMQMEDVGKKEIRSYLSYLNENYSISSARHHYTCVSGMFSWALENDIIDEDPFYNMHVRHKTPKRLPRIIPLHEIRRLLELATAMTEEAGTEGPDYFCALRRQLMLELLLRTGMRIHELCGIKLNDIDMYTRTIVIIGKGNKERKCYITSENLFTLLETYINVRKNFLKRLVWDLNKSDPSKNSLMISAYGNPLSTQAARKDIHRMAETAGIKMNITPHMFRHTFASMLIEQGVELSYIQKYLGHSSIATTQIYLHIGDEAARKVLEEKFPKIL